MQKEKRQKKKNGKRKEMALEILGIEQEKHTVS